MILEKKDCPISMRIVPYGAGWTDVYFNFDQTEDWIKKVLADIDIANIENPRVPAITYFYIREEDDAIIGMIASAILVE